MTSTDLSANPSSESFCTKRVQNQKANSLNKVCLKKISFCLSVTCHILLSKAVLIMQKRNVDSISVLSTCIFTSPCSDQWRCFVCLCSTTGMWHLTEKQNRIRRSGFLLQPSDQDSRTTGALPSGSLRASIQILLTFKHPKQGWACVYWLCV